MTLCDNGLLTYHPSLHVSLGEGRPGGGGRLRAEAQAQSRGADSGTAGKQAQ